MDRLRRQGRQRLRESPLTGLHDGIAGEPTNHPEASDHRAPHAALRALTPGQQRAVRLLRLEEMSLNEAETASGTSIASLKVTLHRALKSLRKILSDRSQT